MYFNQGHQPEDDPLGDEGQRLCNGNSDGYSDSPYQPNNGDSNTTHSGTKLRGTWLTIAVLLPTSVLLSTLALGYHLGLRSNQPHFRACTCGDATTAEPSTTNALAAAFQDDGDSSSTPSTTTAAPENIIPRVPLSTVITTYRPNIAFTQVPQPGETEPAWDSLLPQGLGYVRNDLVDSFSSPAYMPTTAISVVSAFHQLHCLYTLRRAFFANLNDVDEEIQDFDFGKPRVEHATHCFEYLRLSLMCNADSNLEPADFTRGEYFGWEVNRRCRNYERLKTWTRDRRALDAEGFLAEGLGAHIHHETL